MKMGDVFLSPPGFKTLRRIEDYLIRLLFLLELNLLLTSKEC